MTRRTTIAAAVVRTKAPVAQPLAGPPPEAASPAPPRGRGRPAGEATVPHQVRLPKAAKAQLIILSGELTQAYGRSVMEQDLLRYAVDLMFERFGKPAIAGGPDYLLSAPDSEAE